MPTPPEHPTGRHRRTAPRVALIFVGLAAALGLVELGVRLWAPYVREHALPRELVSADDLLGWRLTSSTVSRHRGQYFDTEYATNALGYRDRPRSPGVAAPYRLLLFGDSQVFGWGLPAERRFSDLVEDADAGLEIWNLGVPGYGLDQQVLSYERDTAAWSADGVVFFVSRFTERRLHHDYVSGYHKPIFHLTGAGGLELTPPAGAMARSRLFALPHWLYTPYLLDRLLARTDDRWRSGGVVSPSGAPDLFAAVLGLGARLGEERDQTVFVLSSLGPGGEERLRALSAHLGIDNLALGLPTEQTDLVFGPYDAHWNASANRRISQSLGRQLATIAATQRRPPSPTGP